MTIAIIAHDGKKAEMVQFINEQAEILHKNEIENSLKPISFWRKVKKAGL